MNALNPFADRIRLGFCWIFKDCTPEEGLARLRRAGFDGIELWPDMLEQWGAPRWAEALKRHDMQCLQLCPYFNFVSGTEARAVSDRLFHESLRQARILDCRRLRVFTGPPWGQGVVGAKDATEAQWNDAIQGLREYADRAAAGDIELCLECHEGSLMEDSTSTLRLLNAVSRPNLTVNLQIPLLNESFETSLTTLARQTVHIHIHNWTQGLGKGPITFLDAGVFDWSPVVQTILSAHDRTLTLSVEHADHYGKDDPWETARRDGAYLATLRAGLSGIVDRKPPPTSALPRSD